MLFNFTGHEACFRFRVQRLIVTNPLSGRVLGPERFLFSLDVVPNDTAGNVQDILCRAVVFFQANDLRRRKMLFEFENVLNVGAAPTIYRLIRIADNADVLLPFCQEANQRELQLVCILILVDQKVTEAIVVLLTNLRHIAQQPYCFD